MIGIAVAAGTLTTGILVAAGIGQSAGPYDGWACPRERIATHTLELAGDEGVETEELAIANYLEFLATDGAIVSLDQHLAALSQRSGETYFDPSSGRIHVDGGIRAEFSVTALSKGGFAVTRVVFCSTPPDPSITSPGLTPGSPAPPGSEPT
jgi:hypothetical protein